MKIAVRSVLRIAVRGVLRIARKIRTALSVIVFTFTFCGLTASAQTIVLTENFDSVSAPDLPNGWQIQGSGWATSGSSASPGSSGNNLSHTGSSEGFVVSPSIDLSGLVSPQLTFLARRTSSYPQDSLAIHASIDGGASYPILVAAGGLPLPVTSSTYESIVLPLPGSLADQPSVQIRFQALGGTTGGSNIRLDDLVLTAVLDTVVSIPPDSVSTIGFDSPSSSVLEQSNDISLSIDLSTTDSLHSLQFSVFWSSSIVSLSDVQAGVNIADSQNWQLDWAAAGDSVQILLVANNVVGLMPGLYPDFLSLHFNTGTLNSTVSELVQLSISRVIAARPTPAGDDAVIGLSQFQHELSVEARQAFFEVSDFDLNFGFVEIDSVSVLDFTISNPLGTKDLEISNISSNNPLFSPVDTTLSVPPNQSSILRVAFRPTSKSFGYQTGSLAIEHNGTGSSGNSSTGKSGKSNNSNGIQGSIDIISISGIGTGGRGDADSDGVVDIGDVIVGIDVILGRLQLPQGGVTPIDVHPFPSGNNELDVRDLTVLMHAIVRGFWPDSIGVPSISPNQQPTQSIRITRSESEISTPVSVLFQFENDQSIEVYLSNVIPIRGFELHLDELDGIKFDPFYSIASKSPALVSSHFDQASRSARILLASSSESSIDPGFWRLGEIIFDEPRSLPRVVYATAFDDHRHRLAVEVGVVGVATESDEKIRGSKPSLGAPFPNPYSLGTSTLITIPITGRPANKQLELELYDILGRRLYQFSLSPHVSFVQLDPRNQKLNLSPGVYFLRMVNGGISSTRTITITHSML